jgi:hypothetical protein
MLVGRRSRPESLGSLSGICTLIGVRRHIMSFCELVPTYEKRAEMLVGRRSRSQWLANRSVALRFDRLA